MSHMATDDLIAGTRSAGAHGCNRCGEHGRPWREGGGRSFMCDPDGVLQLCAHSLPGGDAVQGYFEHDYGRKAALEA